MHTLTDTETDRQTDIQTDREGKGDDTIILTGQHKHTLHHHKHDSYFYSPLKEFLAEITTYLNMMNGELHDISRLRKTP